MYYQAIGCAILSVNVWLLALRECVMKLMSWIFGLSIGEAILLSQHLMVCKMHEGACLCCASKTSGGTAWVHLFVIREDDIQFMGYHTLSAWEYDIREYGVTIHGWQPAEQVLPISVIQRIKAK